MSYLQARLLVCNPKNIIQDIIDKHPCNVSTVLKNQHAEIYEWLLHNVDGSSYSEKVYKYLNGESDSICYSNTCHNTCTFQSLFKGYSKYCSYDCSGGSKRVKRVVNTCEWCNSTFKTREINTRRFCSNECRIEYGKTSECNEKRVASNIRSNRELYGVDYFYQTPDFLEKSKETKKEKYGDPTYVNSEKAKRTKLKRYGDPTYNNFEKYIETCKNRYGVSNTFFLGRSNGKRISKGQRNLYEKVKQEYPDAILEHYLRDVGASVDIFIPSINKIIEYYGDYWHCNPKYYEKDYYNKSTKMTASELWDRDREREERLVEGGYDVKIVWENKSIRSTNNIKKTSM